MLEEALNGVRMVLLSRRGPWLRLDGDRVSKRASTAGQRRRWGAGAVRGVVQANRRGNLRCLERALRGSGCVPIERSGIRGRQRGGGGHEGSERLHNGAEGAETTSDWGELMAMEGEKGVEGEWRVEERTKVGKVDVEEDVVEMKRSRSREVVASRASFDKFAAVALAELAV